MKLTETWKKLTTPRSWRALMICSAAAAAFCGVLAIVAGPSTSGMIDAWLTGWNAAAAFYLWLQQRALAREEKLHEICTEQQAMLRAFMEDKVKVHFMGMVEEETPPTAPRLH